jgi:hypothetical protein
VRNDTKCHDYHSVHILKQAWAEALTEPVIEPDYDNYHKKRFVKEFYRAQIDLPTSLLVIHVLYEQKIIMERVKKLALRLFNEQVEYLHPIKHEQSIQQVKRITA